MRFTNCQTSVRKKLEYKKKYMHELSYNFSEPVQSSAVFARQDLDLGVWRHDGILAQYYYVCVVPLGVLVDYIEFIEEILHVAVNAVVDGGECLLCLLLRCQLTLLDASNAMEGKKITRCTQIIAIIVNI